MRLVELVYPHRRAAFAALLLGLAAGLGAVFTSARGIYPEVAFPRIAVLVERGEAPVRGMLEAVTRPVEQAVATTPGLRRMRSKTVRGASELSLDFTEAADMREALSWVRARVAQTPLPADSQIAIERQTPAVFPVLSFNVLPGPIAADDPVARSRLTEWAELEVKTRLLRLPDVFRATVQSGDRREFVVEVDPAALAQAGIDVRRVQDALRAANQVTAVGRLPAEGLQYQLLVDGLIREPAQLLDVAVPRTGAPPVALRQVARLVETTAERTVVVTGGGADGVVVSVFLRDGGRVTDLSADVARLLDEVGPLVPGGGRIVPVYDQATLVNDSIHGVLDAIGLGAVLAVLVIALFLGSVRITLVAGLAIPASVVLTLALFPPLGESLNLMSLGGLAVAIGLIIDDSIVVVENVARRLATVRGADQSLDRAGAFRAVAHGTSEVVGAIVGSSLTTVVVFAPLVLLQGVVGQFFRSLALALGVSIVVSTVVSLVYAPLLMLSGRLLPTRPPAPRRWMVSLRDGYARALGGALRHPLPVAAGMLALVLGGTAGVLQIPTGFLPEMDEGGFVLDYTLPVGSSLQETDAACRRIERILLATPEVASMSRRTGAELGFFATEQFTGDMLVGLRPRDARQRSVFDVIAELRNRIKREVPQSEVEFIQVMQDTIADLAGNPSPIEVKVLGTDYAALQLVADAVAARLEQVPGLVDVHNHVSFGSPELVWRVDPLAAAGCGLTTETIAAEAAAQLLGTVATQILQRDRLIDVRVRYPEALRSRPSTDGTPAVFVPAAVTSSQARVPIAAVSQLERRLNENELERENQTPMVRVTAGVAGRDLGSASAAAAAALRSLPLPADTRLEMGGQAAGQREAFHHLLLVFGLGGALVLLLLVAQFRSARLAAVLLLALPFGQVGGLLALRLTGVPLNVSSGMGLIMLVGLAVKNGIILIEHSQQLARSGLDEPTAIVAAARVRLRPILMTTLAAIAGLLPLALGIGAGAELQRPLAVAVIGGLAVSTAFALFAVPLGCATLARGQLVGEERHDA